MSSGKKTEQSRSGRTVTLFSHGRIPSYPECQSYTIELDIGNGKLTETFVIDHDVCCPRRPVEPYTQQNEISYEFLCRTLEEHHAEHLDIYRRLTCKNYREWLKQYAKLLTKPG